MKKLLILFAFIGVTAMATKAFAQFYGYGGMYFPNYGIYPQYWSTTDKVTYGIYSAFDTLQGVTNFVNYHNQVEAQINARRSSLENQKSLQRMETEGIPPFAPIAPDGKPRSPKITWQDVNEIRP